MAIPEGFHSVTPFIVVPNALAALEFYAKAFGAEIVMRMPGEDEKTSLHAEMKIGNSIVMLSEENPAWDTKTANTLGGSPVGLMLYVDDADASFAKAVDAGCEVAVPPTDMFWGDRFGKVKDPYGLQWSIATQTKVVSEEELEQGRLECLEQMKNSPE